MNKCSAYFDVEKDTRILHKAISHQMTGFGWYVYFVLKLMRLCWIFGQWFRHSPGSWKDEWDVYEDWVASMGLFPVWFVSLFDVIWIDWLTADDLDRFISTTKSMGTQMRYFRLRIMPVLFTSLYVVSSETVHRFSSSLICCSGSGNAQENRIILHSGYCVFWLWSWNGIQYVLIKTEGTSQYL